MDVPEVEPVDAQWCRVSGVFFRGVDPQHCDQTISGSRLAGRYSSPEQPTLYLSSSEEGVAAALVAHADARAVLTTIPVEVDAAQILDLRDAQARRHAGVELSDAVAPWQQAVEQGGEPSSWRVRRTLEAVGANGLIDPSRQAPGLWHLVLFRWNRPGAPSVRVR